jgi:putative ABC transport system permease protein
MALGDFWQDVRYGLRSLRKSPGFAVVAILTLSLGIGASSWLFNMMRQWVFDVVDFPQPSQIVVLEEVDTRKGFTSRASAPDFLDWREQSPVFENLSAWTFDRFNITSGDTPERIAGSSVSANFLRALKVTPAMGRDFLPEEEKPGAAHVAIISYGFWHERYNADPKALNTAIKIDGEPYTIVGVMPEDFHFILMGRANILVPLVFTDKQRADRGIGWLNTIGRLKPGIAVPAAQQAMNNTASAIEKEHPDTNKNSGVTVNSLAHEYGTHTGTLQVATGFVVGFCILLIACSNIAGMYLARTMARRKEMTMRLALGARRGRLARQLLAENAVLLPVSVGIALVFAWLGGRWVTSSIPFESRGFLPNDAHILMDWTTIVYAVGVSIFSMLLFSLAPMLESRKLSLTGVLKEAGGTTSASSGRMRMALVVGEVVLALLVLVPAGLVSKSLANRFKEDPGFRSDHVLTAQMDLPSARYKDKNQVANFYNELLLRLRGMPQVESASISRFIPFGHSYSTSTFFIDGRPDPAPDEVPGTVINSVTPSYISALGLHLVRGRFITDQDGANATPAIVINDTLVRRFFQKNDPLGHKIRFKKDSDTWYTIVGVVKNVKLGALSDKPQNQIYLPFAQAPNNSTAIALHTTADPLSLASSVRNAVWSLDHDLPLSGVQPLEQRVMEQESPERIFSQFATSFGMLALFLAAIGIYGVMAYLVESRTREIGVRMALGAKRSGILRLVLAGAMKLVLAGVTIGLLASWILARFLTKVLFGVSANDPSTYLVAVSVLCGVILLACLVPLRRATAVDPMVVLRYE